MLSSYLNTLKSKANKIGHLKSIGSNELLFILEKCSGGNELKDQEIILLLNSLSQPKNRSLILDYSSSYQRPFDDYILLLSPLYFSSICENKCLYCNFSNNGYRLSFKEFECELNKIIEMGYHNIELVSGQDPELFEHQKNFQIDQQYFNIDKTLEYFKIANDIIEKKDNGMLISNIPPVDDLSFSKLIEYGLDCFLLWLETFDPFQYAKLHYSQGPKANQAFRIDSLERALQLGVKHIAGAFLKGLSDWKKEEFYLYKMDRYLKKKYGKGFSIIGTPRLKGRFQKSKIVKDFVVSDEDYELNVALDRILFDGILWYQTRESFKTNLRLITKYGGGVILTLDCHTAPGGYYKPFPTKSQFPVSNPGQLKTIPELKKKGFKILFNWGNHTLSKLQR